MIEKERKTKKKNEREAEVLFEEVAEGEALREVEGEAENERLVVALLEFDAEELAEEPARRESTLEKGASSCAVEIFDVSEKEEKSQHSGSSWHLLPIISEPSAPHVHFWQLLSNESVCGEHVSEETQNCSLQV